MKVTFLQSESLNAILCQYLNVHIRSGKLATRDSRIIVPAVFRMLRENGMASLLLLVNHAAKFIFPRTDSKTFGIVKMTNLVHHNVTVASILVYVIHDNIGMVVRKCGKTAHHHTKWGCIDMSTVPSKLISPAKHGTPIQKQQSQLRTANISNELDFRMNTFRPFVENLPAPVAVPPDFHNRNKYVPDYISNLFSWLNQAEKDASLVFDDSLSKLRPAVARGPGAVGGRSKGSRSSQSVIGGTAVTSQYVNASTVTKLQTLTAGLAANSSNP